jgi:hypothetical protein
MDIIQVGRIIKRIADLLQTGSNEPQAAALAKDYVECCRATARRLEQCETMLKAGDDFQALQLAEAPPALLDLITLLGFRSSAEWRTYCVKHQFATAEPFDNDAIRRLNGAYARGIPADHRLYKDYRQAIFGHKLDEALLAGRLILKLNPADKELQADNQRLEAQVLEARLKALAGHLREQNSTAVVDAIGEIEALNLPTSIQQPTWKEAQLFLVRLKLEELQQVYQQADWLRALWAIEEIRVLLARPGLQLEGIDLEKFNHVESWASARNTAFQAEQTHQRALQAVEGEFENIEKLVLSAPLTSLPELRAAQKRMETRWDEFTRLPGTLGEPLQKRHQNGQRLVNARLVTLEQARKKKLLVLSSLAGGAVVCLVVLFALVASGSSEAGHLRRLISVRDVPALSNRLATARTKLATRANLGGLATAIQEAETSLAKELALKLAFDQLAGETQATMPSPTAEIAPASLVAIQAKVTALTANCADLAPEFFTPAQASLASITNAWMAYLKPHAQSVNNSFNNLLAEVGKAADPALQYTNPVDAVIRTLQTEIKPRLAQLRALADAPVPGLQISSNLLADFDRRRDAIETFEHAATNYAATLASLPEVRTLDDYLARLALLNASRFQLQIQDRFTTLPTWRSSATNALGCLLFRNDVAAWQYFLKASSQIFRPAKDLPTEDKIRLSEMLYRPWVADITSYTIQQRSRSNDVFVEETKNVFLHDIPLQGFKMKPVKGKEIYFGPVYDPTASPGFPTFQVREYESGSLGSQAKKPPFTPERDIMINTGFKDLAEERGDTSHGLLHCLDALNQHTSGNPLCRAWIFLEACAILETNKYAWGGQYAPALAAHRDQILKIVEGDLRPGDWMVPVKQKYAGKLEAHFQEARGVSYVKQALLLHALVEESSHPDLVFAGYADPRGQLVLFPDAGRDNDLFAWDKVGLRPQLVAQWNKTASRHSLVCEPAALSPIFALRQQRETIKERASSRVTVSLKDPSVESWLPPLFN